MKKNFTFVFYTTTIVFLLVFGLIIFGSAGSFSYIDGWIFWITFSLWTLGFGVYFMKHDQRLMQSRIYGGPTAEKKPVQQFVQAVAGILFILMLILPGLNFRFSWSDLPIVLVILGDIFVMIGFFIVFKVFKENSFTSATIEVQENQEVIETGPYSVVRHPMYSGALLLIIFTPVALGFPIASILVIPMIGVIILRLLDEEKFLLENLKGYKEYCKKVKYRLLPGIY